MTIILYHSFISSWLTEFMGVPTYENNIIVLSIEPAMFIFISRISF